MKVAIDLLWVKHQKVGGIESYVRNLLDGFISMKEDFSFVLLVSKDNGDSALSYPLSCSQQLFGKILNWISW